MKLFDYIAGYDLLSGNQQKVFVESDYALNLRDRFYNPTLGDFIKQQDIKNPARITPDQAAIYCYKKTGVVPTLNEWVFTMAYTTFMVHYAKIETVEEFYNTDQWKAIHARGFFSKSFPENYKEIWNKQLAGMFNYSSLIERIIEPLRIFERTQNKDMLMFSPEFLTKYAYLLHLAIDLPIDPDIEKKTYKLPISPQAMDQIKKYASKKERHKV